MLKQCQRVCPEKIEKKFLRASRDILEKDAFGNCLSPYFHETKMVSQLIWVRFFEI